MIKLKTLFKSKLLLEKIAIWRADDRVRSVLLTPYVQSVDIDQQNTWASKVIISESEFFYYIFDDDELVGYCALIKVKMVPRSGELSILIDPDKNGKGFGSAAIKELLKIAFLEYGLNCVHVEVYGTTDRHKVFEKLGFNYDGTLRARKFWNGEFFDSRMYSMLAEEFNGV